VEFLCFSLGGTSGARAITSAGQHITVPGGEGEQVRIYNSGPNAVAALSGAGSQTAIFPTDAATPNGSGAVIGAGGVEIFTCQAADIHFITLAGQTATVYFSRGKGA
jgi:hypothetical protein